MRKQSIEDGSMAHWLTKVVLWKVMVGSDSWIKALCLKTENVSVDLDYMKGIVHVYICNAIF